MKKLFFLVVIFIFIPNYAFAKSYVLPYPSLMPGNIFYKFNLVKESALKFWYFGNFGQFEYNLKESDRYLVEAKTLFEYEQFLLAYKALQKSDEYFVKTLPFLMSAQKEGKNINQDRELLKEASLKHIQVLSKLTKDTPLSFVWEPEKEKSRILNIRSKLEQSIVIRAKYL